MQLSMSQASLFGGTPAYLYFQVHIYVWYGCLMYLFISAIVNHVGFTSFVTVTDINGHNSISQYQVGFTSFVTVTDIKPITLFT